MIIPGIRIAATAYAVPPSIESVEAVMDREKARIETALEPLGQHARKKALEGLGLSRVHVCGAKQPYDLVLEAARTALDTAGLRACDLHLIIDYSTLPGENSLYMSFAHALSRDLGTEASLNLSFKAGGCAGLHMAIKTALAWMAVDDNLRTALLVTGDTAPDGNRSLLPVTVQGDAGSAVVLTRDDSKGPVVLDVEVMTLGHLHDVIALRTWRERPANSCRRGANGERGNANLLPHHAATDRKGFDKGPVKRRRYRPFRILEYQPTGPGQFPPDAQSAGVENATHGDAGVWTYLRQRSGDQLHGLMPAGAHPPGPISTVRVRWHRIHVGSDACQNLKAAFCTGG